MSLVRSMSLMGNGGAPTVSESLSRANSANLSATLILLSAETEAIVSNTLRRAKSLSCATAGRPRREVSFLKPSEKVWDYGGLVGVDTELDSVCSDDFSLSESLDTVVEPRRVSKEILRSLSTSYRWLEVPVQDFGIPPCAEANPSEEEEDDIDYDIIPFRSEANTFASSPVSSPLMKKHFATASSANHAYMHECRTGKSIATHEQLRTAMDYLGTWSAELPSNCSVRYTHDSSGQVVSLAWPDMEAGGVEDIESFVSAVNGVEGRLVFFPRYGRLHVFPAGGSRLSKAESAMESLERYDSFPSR